MRRITASLHMHTNAQVTLLHFFFRFVFFVLICRFFLPLTGLMSTNVVQQAWIIQQATGIPQQGANLEVQCETGRKTHGENLQLLDFLNWRTSWYLLTPHKSVRVFLLVALRFHSMGGASLWAYSPHIGNISRQIIGPTVTRKSWHIASTNQLFCQHIPLRNVSSSELASVWQVLETKQC